MAVSTAKENILERIRQALLTPVPLPFPLIDNNLPVFPPPQDALELVFAEEFTKLQGKFVFCINEQELIQQVQQLVSLKQWNKLYCSDTKWSGIFGATDDLAGCDASVTGCDYLVARTGSILLSAALQQGRTASVYAPVHICIAYNHQLVFDIKEALIALQNRYQDNMPSFITLASGPSRTADIEKTLVTGVHGPKEVYLFLVDSQ